MNWTSVVSSLFGFGILILVMLTLLYYIQYRTQKKLKTGKQKPHPTQGRYFQRFLPLELKNKYENDILKSQNKNNKIVWTSRLSSLLVIVLGLGIATTLIYNWRDHYLAPKSISEAEYKELKVEAHLWQTTKKLKLNTPTKTLRNDLRFVLLQNKVDREENLSKEAMNFISQKLESFQMEYERSSWTNFEKNSKTFPDHTWVILPGESSKKNKIKNPSIHYVYLEKNETGWTLGENNISPYQKEALESLIGEKDTSNTSKHLLVTVNVGRKTSLVEDVKTYLSNNKIASTWFLTSEFANHNRSFSKELAQIFEVACLSDNEKVQTTASRIEQTASLLTCKKAISEITTQTPKAFRSSVGVVSSDTLDALTASGLSSFIRHDINTVDQSYLYESNLKNTLFGLSVAGKGWAHYKNIENKSLNESFELYLQEFTNSLQESGFAIISIDATNKDDFEFLKYLKTELVDKQSLIPEKLSVLTDSLEKSLH